ncbi:MAG: type II toxin-antitoxin system prevent-host-death family antitoxin [Dermatophilus congolensis]|nr:type II toxin-antitoxin system prevent-host-death family antitoxin [Dermatophilus congolensis]
MTTISQRELRNDNAEIMRRVEQGESFTVTRRGVPVASVTPITRSVDLPLLREATPGPRFSDIPRAPATVPSAQILDDLRGDR